MDEELDKESSLEHRFKQEVFTTIFFALGAIGAFIETLQHVNDSGASLFVPFVMFCLFGAVAVFMADLASQTRQKIKP